MLGARGWAWSPPGGSAGWRARPGEPAEPLPSCMVSPVGLDGGCVRMEVSGRLGRLCYQTGQPWGRR